MPGRFLTTIDWIQSFVAVACLVAVGLSIAASIKLQLAEPTLEWAYRDILAVRDDAWLGIAEKLSPWLLAVAASQFFVVWLIGISRRRPWNLILCGVCGLALGLAVVWWSGFFATTVHW